MNITILSYNSVTQRATGIFALAEKQGPKPTMLIGIPNITIHYTPHIANAEKLGQNLTLFQAMHTTVAID